MKTKVGLIALGCDKNRVDSENMLGFLSRDFDIVSSYEEADVVIINTCSFIESAVQESIDAIMEAAKTTAKLIVTGCLPMRYPTIAEQNLMPEVSAFLDNHHYDQIADTVRRVVAGERIIQKNGAPQVVPVSNNRILTTPMHYAYLKIAEGCNNACAYCAIPAIRGRYIATPLEDLVEEAQRLYDNYGVQELILVAQDVTRYSYQGRNLLDLLDALETTPIPTFRLTYCYPELVTKELIDRVESDPRIAKYLDIPMQHASDAVLKRMRRRSTHDGLVALMDYIRLHTHITVRSTFMVGFPGETKEDIIILKQFLREYRLPYAGFFAYFREEGTASYDFDDQIPERVKQKRLKEVEQCQSAIMEEVAKGHIGHTLVVRADAIDYDKQCFVGHADFMHPEIDNKVYFGAEFPIEVGEQYRVTIQSVQCLDLIGTAICDQE